MARAATSPTRRPSTRSSETVRSTLFSFTSPGAFSAPGEKFSYSGEGFVYLQRVVEHLTGLQLDALMRREVFEPLGMRRTSLKWRSDFAVDLADGTDLPPGEAGADSPAGRLSSFR